MLLLVSRAWCSLEVMSELRRIGSRRLVMLQVHHAQTATSFTSATFSLSAGEGKSLTGMLPAYLNVLTGKAVYIATVSDYLAKRDCDIFAPVFDMLGIKVLFTLRYEMFSI